jgi:hypothetical protein
MLPGPGGRAIVRRRHDDWSGNAEEPTMPEKPSYLGLLNAIAVAESRAHEYLQAWIAVTPSPDVCAVLRTVAAREGEHGMAFAKRLDELGFQVRVKDDDRRGRALEIAGSDCSDLEKMEALGLGRLDTGSEPDIFDGFFEDHTINDHVGACPGIMNPDWDAHSAVCCGAATSSSRPRRTRRRR